MSQYLVLSHIDIQNANSIAGLTWGFPAITQFLGFTHALSRKLSNRYEGEYDFELLGCAVVSHNIHNKIYQPKQYADFEFLQSKNPPVLSKHKSASPPIIEEGKMNLTASLVIELDTALALTTDQIKELEEKVLALCYCMRIAGGSVLNIKQAKLLSASTLIQHADMLRKIKRLTMPGFVLLDRNDYLQQHYQELLAQHDEEQSNKDKPQLIDAWLDFSALKFKSNPELSKEQSVADENTPANWEYVAKPNVGYLVPIMTGYKAISELYDPGDVQNTRDEITPSRFVEAIHSVGEWKGMHSTNYISDIIWRHHHDEKYEQWYICKQIDTTQAFEMMGSNDNETEETQVVNLNDALNLF
ncbi:MAG: type I-F CRISPR-associated protein Csy2 [Pseudomonadales bacterium]|nr:type I-F CRISPR-associated protein Csy2 [Pseudomonadales bacterium]